MTIAWRRSSHCAYNGNCAEFATTPAETAIRADERQKILERIGDAEYLTGTSGTPPCDGRCPHTRPGNRVRNGRHFHRVTDLLEGD